MIAPILNGESGFSVRAKINTIITQVDALEAGGGGGGSMSGSQIKTAYEGEANTNAFTTAEQEKLALQSGTNTGDQDLSGYQVQPSEGAFVNGDKTKLDAAVQSTTVTDIVSLTQQAYTELPSPDASTFYIITD
jgi:hypothetical protein